MGLALASDARLAKLAARGDPEAFAAIFRRYERDLHRFCVGILREPHRAQDAVQNTMVRAMRALPGESRDMQLKPWLYRIAHNEAVELRRRERPVETLDMILDEGAASPEEQIEQDERLKTLLADVADLPERLRATLVMREVNGLEFGEISAVLGSSPGAVRQALYEARCGLSEMELGRHLGCDVVMRQVSDAEAGRPGRREIRAHLRDCVRCRRFQTEIRERRKTFAANAPVPAIAAVGMLKTAVGGTAGGVAAGTSAGVAAAGSVGIPGLVKAGVAVVAALTIGTAAVDHGALVGRGGGSQALERRQVEPRGGDAMVPRRGSGNDRIVVEAPAGATPRASVGQGTPPAVAPAPEGTPALVDSSVVASPGSAPDQTTDVGPAAGADDIPAVANGLGTESGNRPEEPDTGEADPVESAGSPEDPERPEQAPPAGAETSVETTGTTPSEPTSSEPSPHPEKSEPIEASSATTSSPEVESPDDGKAEGGDDEAAE